MPKIKTALLYKKREKRALTKLGFLLFSLIVVFLIIVFWGLPLLANLAGLISSRFGKSEAVLTNQAFPIPTPEIFELPEATNSARISIAGKGLPNSTVEIFVNAEDAGKVIIKEDGTFEVSNIRLKEGENFIFGQSISSENQKSGASPTKTIFLDKEPPKLSVQEPPNNQKISGEKKVRVTGSTEPGVILKIGEFLPVVDQNGNFSFSYPLNDGENKILIKAQDKAGNTTEVERTALYSP